MTKTQKRTTLIGAIALTLIIGCGLILGNAVLASQAMSTNGEPAGENIIQPLPLNARPIALQQDNAAAGRVSTAILTNEHGETVIVETVRRAAEEANPLYIEGSPDLSKISEETAIANAIELLKGKYALRQETIDRFTVEAIFYTKYEDITEPVWWVNLYPANINDYADIGCYWALINSDTGEAAGLFSAADGRG